MIINEKLNQIAALIKGDSPTFWQTACVGALQYESGKQLIWDGNEATYIGITDNRGNQFYIRYGNSIGASQGERVAACSNTQLSIPLTLVAHWKSANFEVVSSSLIYRLSQYGQITSLDINYENIYKNETLKDTVKRVKDWQLIAINFNIIVKLGIQCPVIICPMEEENNG